MAITTLTLKPNLTGAVTQALHDRNPFYIPAGGLALPVVAYDEEYAESIFMEGGRRTRSREQNPEGKVTLRVTPGLSDATLRTRLTELQQTIQACRIYGGELALALEGQPTVTYDLESCSLASLDLEEVQFGRAVVEINVVTRPYGRLAPVALVVNATSSDPIQSVSLAGIGGSAPALVEATVTDTATQGRDHLEVGLDSDWDGSSALLTDSSSMSVSGLSGTATTKTGAYASQNLVTNPSFETDTTGWSTSSPAYHINSGAVLTRQTPGVAQSGAYVGQIVTPGSAAAEGVAFAFSGYTFLAGTAYTLSMRAMANSATNVDLVLGKASADNAQADDSLAAGTWKDLSVTWTPAADGSTVYAVLRTDLAGSAVARTIQIDAVKVDGASGVIRTAGLGTSAIGCCEKTGLTHRGRHRAKLRLAGAGLGPIYVRVAYRVGAGPWTRNSWKKVQSVGTTTANSPFYELDMGLVQGSPAGTLSVRIEAYSASGSAVDENGRAGDTLDIDYLLLIPVSVWAKARGAVDNTGTAFSTRDSFSQTAGNLDTPKAADVGGNWAVTNRTGANGWVIETTGKTAQRTILSDTFSGANYGAFAQLGSAVAAGSVQGKVKFSNHVVGTNDGLQSFGLLARYVNVTNWVALVMQPSVYGAYLTLIKNVGGTISGIASLNSGYFAVTNFFHPLRLELDADGSYRAYWSGSLMFSGNDPDLSSTGALASGKRGLIDAMGSAIANTRNYDDFATTEPTAQRVVNASGAVILDSDSIARSDGSRPAIFEGSYLKSPPAGREARTHRLAVKLRRNDVDTAPDDSIADGQRVDVTVTPRVVLL